MPIVNLSFWAVYENGGLYCISKGQDVVELQQKTLRQNLPDSIWEIGPVQIIHDGPDNFYSRSAFETLIRSELKPHIGDEAAQYTELDYISDLAEDGWPDSEKWLEIFSRLSSGSELTPEERQKAHFYYNNEEDARIPSAKRI